MKRLLFFIPVFFIFYSCGKLSTGKAEELINKKHSYPQPVELDFVYDYVVPISGNIAGLADYPGIQVSDKEARLVMGFSSKGLVKLSDKIMTGKDATLHGDNDAVTWHHYTATLTEEGKKYSSGVDETEENSGKNIYKITLFDEQLGQITGMIEQESGRSFEVHYTTVRANPTPFFDVYKQIYGSAGLYDISKVGQETETFEKSGLSWKID